MTMTQEQAEKIRAEMIETIKLLIICLDEHQTPTLVGEMALAMLVGTSVGVSGKSLDDIVIPTLKLGWESANEQRRKGMQ